MQKFTIDQARLARYCDAADASSAAVREANAAEREARERFSRRRREIDAITAGRGARGEAATAPSKSDLKAIAQLEAEVERCKTAAAKASEIAVHARRIAASCLEHAKPKSRQLMVPA